MSKIKELSIFKYKSISKLEIALNQNLNIIIGANNSGKTNIINTIFEGLNLTESSNPYLNISRIDNFEGKKPRVIFKTFENETIIFNEENTNNFVKYKKGTSITHVNSEAKKAINKNIKIAKIDNSSNMENLIKEMVDYIENLEVNDLSNVMSNINRDLLVLSNEYYSISAINNQIFVADSFGDTSPIYEKSNGVKKLVIMAYWLNIYNKVNNKLPDIILFDEPEIHLHIEAQRYLYKKIKETFKNSQIIISTHSTAFINDTDMENIILVDRDVMRGTYIDFNKEDKEKILKINQIMGINLLDTLRIDINATVVMVEGKTDKILHNYIYHRIYPNKKLTFIEVGGANKITDFISVYTEVFPNPPLGILDFDAKGTSLIKHIKYKFSNRFDYRIILNNQEFIIQINDDSVKEEDSIQVEDLFKKDFIVKCLKELFEEEHVSEYYEEKLSEYKNFKTFENKVKETDIEIRGSKYSVNKFKLNTIIIKRLKSLSENEFLEETSRFKELYFKLNKNK